MSTVHEAKILKMSGRDFKMLIKESLVTKIVMKEAKFLYFYFKMLAIITCTSCFSSQSTCNYDVEGVRKKTRSFSSALKTAHEFAADKARLQSQVKNLESQVITPRKVKKQLLGKVTEGFESGAFNSPIRKVNLRKAATPNHAQLKQQIESIDTDTVTSLTSTETTQASDPTAILETARAELFKEVSNVFEQYVDRKLGASETSLVATNNSTSTEVVALSPSPKKKSVKITLTREQLIQAFELATLKLLNPTMSQFLNAYQLQVALPTVHQPTPSPVLDLKKEGKRYVQKIEMAINSEQALYNLVQQYRHDRSETQKHAMLLFMLDHNIESVATSFRPSAEASTMIETGEELRDQFFQKALLTFIHYISGNTNKEKVTEIIALTNGGRGQSIPDAVIASLHHELTEIFYPRRESASFTVTRYDFRRPGAQTGSAASVVEVVDVATNALTTTYNYLFGDCLAPSSQRNLLTNGSAGGGSPSRIRTITDGSNSK